MQFRRLIHSFESEILYLIVGTSRDVSIVGLGGGAIKRESGGLQPPAEPHAAFLNVIELFSYFPFI